MKIGIVIYSNDSESVWNAFRFGCFALLKEDKVKLFLLGAGVECQSLDTDEFKVTELMQDFVDHGGKIFACGGCLELRNTESSRMCPASKMKDMYEIVTESDRVVTF